MTPEFRAYHEIWKECARDGTLIVDDNGDHKCAIGNRCARAFCRKLKESLAMRSRKTTLEQPKLGDDDGLQELSGAQADS